MTEELKPWETLDQIPDAWFRGKGQTIAVRIESIDPNRMVGDSAGRFVPSPAVMINRQWWAAGELVNVFEWSRSKSGPFLPCGGDTETVEETDDIADVIAEVKRLGEVNRRFSENAVKLEGIVAGQDRAIAELQAVVSEFTARVPAKQAVPDEAKPEAKKKS